MNRDLRPDVLPHELGRRLAAARRGRSMTQEEVARSLGVSRPTLVAIEKGTRPIRSSELIALAQMFGRSIHELVNAREYLGDFAPQFRMTQVDRIPAESVASAVDEFQKLCETYVHLENLVEAPAPRYSYPEQYPIAGSRPRTAAEEVATLERSRLNLGLGPVANLLEVMEADVGLRVFVIPLAEFLIAGLFAYTDRLGGCIMVNGAHPTTRQRDSIAHEYAHFLTDRYQNDVTVLAEYERRTRAEQFADQFAACFLMPAAGLRHRFHRVVQSKQNFTVADLCLLANQYEVSVEAMTRRLEGLGSLPRGTWRGLSDQGFQAHRANEHLRQMPKGQTHLRLPERYVRLAVQAFEEEKITESELARSLRCTRVEARETVQALTEAEEMSPLGQPRQLRLRLSQPVPIAAAQGG